jgi:hypothetical protein
LSLIGNIIGGFMNSSAANNAANTLVNGATQAQNTLKQQQGSAIDALKAAAGSETAGAAPYTSLGGGTANSLATLLMPGGALTQGYGSFSAPTAAQAAATPGYQFQLSQGLQALNNSAAATGGLVGGNAMKGIEDYAQGLASTNYQNAFNNSLASYSTNFNTFNTGQNNLFNRLFGSTQLGAGTQNSLNSLLQSGAGMQSNVDLSTGAEIAQQQNNAAAARASGIIGSTNAWTNSLGNIFNMGQSFLGSQQGAGSMLNQSGNGFLNFLGNAAAFL